MKTVKHQYGKKQQRGIVLLMIVVVIALTITAYYFSSISIVEIKFESHKNTRLALKKAKQALISYAITHADGNGTGEPGEYGYLPCPHISNGNEGMQDLTCGSKHVNSIGYLPWVSMQIAPIRDGSGHCLWYAVSGSYKNNPNSGLINEDTNGMFQVVDSTGAVLVGSEPEDRIVAVIFSPGSVLDSQNRTYVENSKCGQDGSNTTAYLEGVGAIDNAVLQVDKDKIDQFIHATLTSAAESEPYNDNIITITRNDIWQAIMRRSDLNNRLSEVTESLAECLAEYVNHPENLNKRLPWPAKSYLEGGDYRATNNYSDELNALTGYAGRFPFHLDNSNTEIATITTIAADYLDDSTDVICNNLNLAISGVANVNLTDESLEHRKIINNWKDHFFYVASSDYALPDVTYTGCVGNCVSVGGTEYAAIIFFSASPYAAQSRKSATKDDIANYLENGNDVIFPDVGGNGAYTTTDPDPLISNDIMFCLTDDANRSVVAC